MQVLRRTSTYVDVRPHLHRNLDRTEKKWKEHEGKSKEMKGKLKKTQGMHESWTHVFISLCGFLHFALPLFFFWMPIYPLTFVFKLLMSNWSAAIYVGDLTYRQNEVYETLAVPLRPKSFTRYLRMAAQGSNKQEMWQRFLCFSLWHGGMLNNWITGHPCSVHTRVPIFSRRVSHPAPTEKKHHQ